MKPTYEELTVQLANAESKCRELVVECSTIKAMSDCLSEELRGYESDGAFEGPKMHLLWWKAETPATDAFLAEVRAQVHKEGAHFVANRMLAATLFVFVILNAPACNPLRRVSFFYLRFCC